MEFDKNVPLPTRVRGGWPKKYFFDQMAVGDSQEFDINVKNGLNAARVRIARRTGYKFIIRSIGNKVRIWRIK